MLKVGSALVCLLALCFAGGNALCADKNALYTVNATVRKSIDSGGSKVLNVNFYTLERFAVIDVTRANVTDLCEGIVKNLPNLQSLSLINVNLSKIEPDAFQKVPKLRELSLAVNNLTEIVSGSFNNLAALEVLYLSANEIATVEEHSFANLPKLRVIRLDRNKITGLNGNLFYSSSSLQLVDLKFNLIQSVTKESFQDLRPNHRSPISILLQKNRIRDVDSTTFGMSNPVYLHLEGNNIALFHSDLLFGLKENSRIYLDGNQVSCLPEEVIEAMRNTTKELYVLDNPLDCECVNRIDQKLDEVYGSGKLVYSSTFPCQFLQSGSFD